MTQPPKAIILGVVGGFLAGLFGIGGGVVMVPVLVLWLRLEQHAAHATSVAAVIFTTGVALIPFALDGEVRWDFAGWILIGSLTGAYLGANVIGRLSPLWLARGFVALAVAAATRMLVGSSGDSAVAAASDPSATGWTIVGLALIGLVAGTIAAALGVGGGIMYVPALVFAFSFVQHEAQGTSLAIIVPAAMLATTVNTRAGRVNWRVAALLAVGALVGSPLGSNVALALDPVVLRRLFAVPVTVAALRMLTKTRRAEHA